MHKVNQRPDYKQEGEGCEEFFRDGVYHNIIYWGILRSEYMANNAK